MHGWRRKVCTTAAAPGSAISSGCCTKISARHGLRALVTNPLTGLTVAAFYGCHITRPPGRYGFVDSRNNMALEKLAEILGCRPIDYSGRTECCGFHTAAHDERVAIKLTGQHILAAKAGGAKTMVTPCPLCHTVLDGFQREIEKDLGQEARYAGAASAAAGRTGARTVAGRTQYRPAHGPGRRRLMHHAGATNQRLAPMSACLSRGDDWTLVRGRYRPRAPLVP